MFFVLCVIFFFKQKTAYEMRISDWSSDVCSSDLGAGSTSSGSCRRRAACRARTGAGTAAASGCGAAAARSSASTDGLPAEFAARPASHPARSTVALAYPPFSLFAFPPLYPILPLLFPSHSLLLLHHPPLPFLFFFLPSSTTSPF